MKRRDFKVDNYKLIRKISWCLMIILSGSVLAFGETKTSNSEKEEIRINVPPADEKNCIAKM